MANAFVFLMRTVPRKTNVLEAGWLSPSRVVGSEIHNILFGHCCTGQVVRAHISCCFHSSISQRCITHCTGNLSKKPAKSWTIFTTPEHKRTMPKANTKQHLLNLCEAKAPAAALIYSPHKQAVKKHHQTTNYREEPLVLTMWSWLELNYSVGRAVTGCHDRALQKTRQRIIGSYNFNWQFNEVAHNISDRH